MSKKKPSRPRKREQRRSPDREPDLDEIIQSATEAMSTPEAAGRVVDRLLELLDQDKSLSRIVFPRDAVLAFLGRVLEQYPDFDQAAPDSQAGAYSLMKDSVSEMITPEFLDEVDACFLESIRTCTSPEDQHALAVGIALVRLHEEDPESATESPLWGYLLQKSVAKLVPDGSDSLSGMLFPALMRDLAERLPEEESGGERTESEAVEDVFHGVELGYLDRYLPFHRFVRLPFMIQVLLEQLESEGMELDTPSESHRKMLIEAIRAVASEIAQEGGMEEMTALCSQASRESSGNQPRQSFYDLLKASLEAYEPTDNPLWPPICFEHYIHYLTSETEKDCDAIHAIFDDPLRPESYEEYACLLRARGENSAAENVERVRLEIARWEQQQRS